MTVEIKPRDNECNLSCTYCYQNMMRDAGNESSDYDVDAILREVERKGEDFSLFGGDPLLLPKEDLERFWEYGYRENGQNSIQTNGVLIDDDHLEMMEKYRVGVGVSVDGPGKLNDLRWAGSLKKTRRSTERTIENIEKMRERGINVGIIITVHRVNAGNTERLSKLKDFIYWLRELGIKGGSLHFYEVDSEEARKYEMDTERKTDVFLELAEFCDQYNNIAWSPFKDMKSLLRADDSDSSCIWNKCDPLTTSAVYGIDGSGNVHNCGMTTKEGIDWIKAENPGYERYISLYQTPQDMGGCKDCRFWVMCGGNCPGKSEADPHSDNPRGDWRNKTTDCETIKALYRYFEKQLESIGVEPLSKSDILDDVEEEFMNEMVQGNKPLVTETVKRVQSN